MTSTPPSAPRYWGSRLLIGVVALCLGLTWLAPTQKVDENRTPAAFPSVTPGGVADGSLFRGTDAALADRVPLKAPTVGTIASALVGAGLSSSTSVIRGRNGDPYYTGDFTGPCSINPQAGSLDARVRALRDRYAALGTHFVYAVPPDKSTAQRDALDGWSPSLLRCADRNREYLSEIASADDSPFLVAWDDFDRAQADGSPLYLTGDSHWNFDGAALFSRLLIERLEREGVAPEGLFDEQALRRSANVDHLDDLYLLMGVQRMESVEPIATVRPGVTTQHRTEFVDGQQIDHWTSTTTGPALIPGKTLILHDSFFAYDAEILAPYFEDITAIHSGAIAVGESIAPPNGYDLVIIQQVQRSVPIFLDSVEAADWIRP